ncbi:hypothetical protein EB230_27915 [Mesorhizobium sp. NZP2234]|nr:hypothetical protein EB230_27915 [Mesorhizobium sp. NZP2234]
MASFTPAAREFRQRHCPASDRWRSRFGLSATAIAGPTPDARRPKSKVGSDPTDHLLVLTQFPRESATRFSRENRFTPFLELL